MVVVSLVRINIETLIVFQCQDKIERWKLAKYGGHDIHSCINIQLRCVVCSEETIVVGGWRRAVYMWLLESLFAADSVHLVKKAL